MSEPTLASLAVRFDGLEEDLREIKQLLKEHAQEMDEKMGGLSNKTNQQEVRLSIVEKQLEESRARGAKLAADVETNKLSLAKASVIAVAAALIIPVVAELVGNQLIQPQHEHLESTRPPTGVGGQGKTGFQGLAHG